ncbi:major allergen Pru ar 1-like [Salvia splendens]|uniref:major allergen Pru ar 1-like n=1 Tax=Salvia splendens TaxID=180675 RepID=UPI001C27CA18|nr:major allergen Pru ar 1-like [Salvia splendens]
MAAIIDKQEIKSSIPAGRLFKAFVLDSDNILPEIMPGVFKSLEIIQGDHDEVGRIKIVTFSPETQIKAAKHRTEAIDEVNYKYKYSLIEGSILGDDLESITYDINVENGENDVVSVMTFVTTYRPKGDNHHSILEKVKQSQERTEGFVRAIEAYILANPFKYNI